MFIAGKTDKGMVRLSNQDDFAAGKLADGACFAVVCDGMGGANGGNVASSTAVETIKKKITEGYSDGLDSDGIGKLVAAAIKEANTAVFEQSRKDQSLLGMGTTVVAAVIKDGFATIAHAGDSRAYLIDDGIRQLTRDHSIVQEMLESGKITKEEAMTHPQKNIITRALGVEQSLDIDFCSFKFSGSSAILICTDGLTNQIDDSQLETVVKTVPPEQCAEKLVGMANEHGGSDNITVVVIYNAQSGGAIDG